MATAIQKLSPSKLSDQQELLKDDVELDSLRLFIRSRSVDVVQKIIDGDVERTIEGASTVSVTFLDPDSTLLNSGLLTSKTDIKVDGLYFRLAHVEKSGDDLTLTFEDREVAVVRTYKSFRKANRDTMTRAEFVHTLVREADRELKIRFFSPEEHVKQKVAPDQSVTGDLTRGGGFSPNVFLTVKGQPATHIQLKNMDEVLTVGALMGVPTVAQEAAIEAVIVESSAMNLAGGDRDSVGIFQQRNSLPWSKRNRRDISAASRTFFEQALRYLDIAKHRGEHVYSYTLAQAVQISAFPERYKQYQGEGEAAVADWTGQDAHNNDVFSSDENPFMGASSGAGVYEFTRGTMDDQGRVKRESTWDAAHRMADEVNWRCFMVSGTMYFISDKYLYRSRARMVISPTAEGIDDIDFDYDQGKKNAQITVTCHVRRWGAPPGSVVKVEDMDPINGRWLVQDIRRSLFNNIASITLVKPLPKLKEPPATSGATGTTDTTILGPTSDLRQAIVVAARRALQNKNLYHYRQYRPMASSLFDAFAYDHTDCSAFATLCYKAAGAPDPNGFDYNGSGNTGTMWARGQYIGSDNNRAQPGDLAFYGTQGRGRSHAITTHVGVYIGGGQMIDFGSNPIKQVSVNVRSDFLGFRTYLDEGASGTGL
jgi:hypothetical protein